MGFPEVYALNSFSGRHGPGGYGTQEMSGWLLCFPLLMQNQSSSSLSLPCPSLIHWDLKDLGYVGAAVLLLCLKQLHFANKNQIFTKKKR